MTTQRETIAILNQQIFSLEHDLNDKVSQIDAQQLQIKELVRWIDTANKRIQELENFVDISEATLNLIRKNK